MGKTIRSAGRQAMLGMLLLVLGAPALPMSVAGERIELDVTTHLGDGQVYREGDKVSFLVSLDRDAYLLIVYQDAAGNLIQLVPNTKMTNAFYGAGLFITIPSEQAPHAFTISAPFGEETVWVFASSTAFPKLAGAPLESGARLLKQDLPALKARLREMATTQGHAYGEAQTSLSTRAQ